MNILITIFKVTGMVACIGLALLVIVSMITAPIKKIKEKKMENKLLAELKNLTDEYIKECKKGKEEDNKKTARKPRNAKKSE